MMLIYSQLLSITTRRDLCCINCTTEKGNNVQLTNFYQTSKQEIAAEFEEVKKFQKISREREQEQQRLEKAKKDSIISQIRDSKDPFYNNEKKEMLKFAANFFFQTRVHTNIFISILDKDHKEDMRIKLEGLDFSLCNPVGPINIKLSLMLRKLSVDTFFRGAEIQNGSFIERKRQGIFGESATDRGTLRGTKAPNGFGQINSHIMDTQFKTVNGEQCLNLFSYRKLAFDVDLDTQIDLNDHIVNIIQVTGSTGLMLMKIATVLTKKIKSLESTLIPEDDPLRTVRAERRAARMKLNFAKLANKFVKGSAMAMIFKNEEKLKRGLQTFGDLQYDDVAKSVVQRTGNKQQQEAFRKNFLAKWRFSPQDQKRMQQEYLNWHRGRFSKQDLELIKSKIESKESTEDKLRQVAKKLQNVILKVGIQFDPVNFEFLDDSGKLVTSLEMDAGKLELKIDEIYTKSHYLKFMGLNVQTKDSIVILGMLLNVSGFFWSDLVEI